ncbi:CoA-binding protein [Uliginosibacterium sp. sgz301328]|uniref:CoA-binding protein n=1 Tax=Uliginosibacterium sp. sgz301328 TaxID=3243764 RepID=UPI00359E30D1
MFTNPDAKAIEQLLRAVKTIAMVGASPDPERPSHHVATSLQSLGYRIVPVRPGLDSLFGEKAYASLRDIPFPVDIVDVFRASAAVGPIVDDAIAIGAPRLWLQEGVVNEPEALRAQAAGMQVVMDRCMWREARRLFGV